MEKLNYREILKTVFDERKKRNSHYSLRAFARDIGVQSGDLTRIINGKRSMSVFVAYRLGKHLNYNPEDLIKFISPTIEGLSQGGQEKVILD